MFGWSALIVKQAVVGIAEMKLKLVSPVLLEDLHHDYIKFSDINHESQSRELLSQKQHLSGSNIRSKLGLLVKI